MNRDSFIPAIERMIEQLHKLPGIGRKTAQRLTFALLEYSAEELTELENAIVSLRDDVCECSICGNVSEEEICPICADAERDHSVICVVEDSRGVLAIEKVREYRGVYHVLHGTISPIDGIGPEELRIAELEARVAAGDVKEIILAMNSTVSGDTTAIYLTRSLKKYDVKISRLAYGLPVGGDIEYADEVTLMRAIEGRNEV